MALVAGLRVVTTGAGVGVVNDHVTSVIVAPAAFVAPEAVTVYVVARASAAVGVNVAVFVVAL